MSNRAWVTLATNDSYGLGALVLAYSLRRAETSYPAVVLITPAVTESMKNRLGTVFAEVITVDVLDSHDAAHLALLQRPELGITFTKIHCWSLTQYKKCVFLDADTLIVQNCDELFEREELSAAPDVGWPDCFNSGVFVYQPSQETFNSLIKFAQDHGSFDGGDQGLLNSFFSDWAQGDIRKHLPFLYNVTSAAFYSYLPALKHFGSDLKIIHFIGSAKPWLQTYDWQSGSVDAPSHLQDNLQLWWNIFVSSVHPQLEESMSGVAGNLARVAPGEVTHQHEAINELNRRQGWEAGNIDYMGADSFDNIWAKISKTLNKSGPELTKSPSPPKESSQSSELTPSELPPKQPSPPKEPLPKQPSPVKDPSPPVKSAPPVEPKQEPTNLLEDCVKGLVLDTKQTVSNVEIAKPETGDIPTQKVASTSVIEKNVEKTKEERKVPVTPPVTPKSTPESATTPVSEVLPTLDTPISLVEPQKSATVEIVEVHKTKEASSNQTSPSLIEDTTSIKDTTAPPVTASQAPLVDVNPPSSLPGIETPEKALQASGVSTDSPPLANTPSKEEIPPSPAKCPNRACSIM